MKQWLMKASKTRPESFLCYALFGQGKNPKLKKSLQLSLQLNWQPLQRPIRTLSCFPFPCHGLSGNIVWLQKISHPNRLSPLSFTPHSHSFLSSSPLLPRFSLLETTTQQPASRSHLRSSTTDRCCSSSTTNTYARQQGSYPC